MPIFEEPIRLKSISRRRPIEYRVSETGCWECTSHAIDSKGYPKLRRYGGYYRVHRYVYECLNGSIPGGLVVMHLCDNTVCMNPEHLRLGTPLDNSRDMTSKGRQLKGVDNRGGVKLNEIDVIAIREDKRTLREIAKDYGVSHSIVYKIKRGELWKHV